MKYQRSFAVSVILFLFCAVSYAGTIYDEFMSAELEDVWEITKTPDAKYEIKDGMLILSTEATAGNIYLWYKDAIPPGEPVTIEARINPGTAESVGDGMVGFLNKKEDAENLNNDAMNGIKNGGTYFWVDVAMQEMRIRGETPGGNNQVNHNNFGEDNFFIFKIEVTEDEFTMWLDDEEIQSGDRIDTNFPERAFHVTPDGANDMHGPTMWTIDYVRLTGPTIPDLDFSAVDPTAKSATTWGSIKLEFLE
ncbi:hypothetical protein ACFL6S_11620 [Candidatus Poribacteria bacterium]